MANAIQRACPKAFINSVIVLDGVFRWLSLNQVNKIVSMKIYTKILFSILVAGLCSVSFAADKPTCKDTGKNCPMNKGKACKCGKECGCGK
jgi:hypothetical protein